MRGMEKFLVERKFDFVPAYESDDTVIDDDGREEIWGTEVFGYSVVENSFEGISVEGTNIKMGDADIIIEVKSCVDRYDCNMEGKLPSLYCVRKHNGTYAQFECGLDLCVNGMIWVGLENRGMFFDTINSAIRYLKDRLGEFEIHTEEPMRSKKHYKAKRVS
jgi:hypothetical protein